jgi:hypothetical protein
MPGTNIGVKTSRELKRYILYRNPLSIVCSARSKLCNVYAYLLAPRNCVIKVFPTSFISRLSTAAIAAVC